MKDTAKKGRGGKVLLTVLIVLLSLIVLYTLFCLIAPHFVYPRFYKTAEKVAVIPDLWSGFIPQGVTETDDGTVLICGYMPGDSASRIYRLTDKGFVRIDLEREDGSVYDGHAGGMTAYGDFVYISNASKIFVLNAADVLDAKDGDTVRFLGYFEVPCRASFCSFSGHRLYVGDFHADGYETEESHVMTTPDGSEHAAMVFGYDFDADARFGVEEVPSIAHSVCDKVQGFAVAQDGTVFLSCSYGLADSELKLYRMNSDPDASFSHEGAEIPLYYLDGKREKEIVRLPHMSEDIEFRDGKLLIAFEAGAKKYGGGLLPFSVRSVMRWTYPDLVETIE